MDEAESLLRAAGCPKINLQVRSTNAEVIAFYKRLGFTMDDVVSLGKWTLPGRRARRVQMSDISQTVNLFREGCACSQAVLSVYGEPLGLPRELAMRIASGFAGGMRMGGTCGAVTGALMVLGLRHTAADAHLAAGRKAVSGRAVEFVNRFKARNGSLVCRDLLACDISTPEGMRQAKEQGLFKTICVKMVEDAAAILEEMDESRPAAAHDR